MRRRTLIAALLLLALCCCGCHKTTTVDRQAQLSQATTLQTTLPASAQTTQSEETTAETVPPTDPTPETTAAPQATTKARETQATSRPTQTTAAPSAAPETTVPEVTAAATEAPETVPAETDPYDISGHTVDELAYSLLDALNAARAAEELPTLTLSSRLCAIASVRAYESSLTFSHTRPDGRGFQTALEDYGFGYGCAAENLLQCTGGYSAQDMAELWLSSDGHRANILSADYTTVGIAVYQKGSMLYVACLFVG